MPVASEVASGIAVASGIVVAAIWGGDSKAATEVSSVITAHPNAIRRSRTASNIGINGPAKIRGKSQISATTEAKIGIILITSGRTET